MIHLHCHSYFSFNRGTIPASELPLLALQSGMRTVAMTDTNNLTGAMEFYRAAKHVGVKPIIGAELRTNHETAVLLAKDIEGYREIADTITSVIANIPQTKPKLTLESLVEGQAELREEESEYIPLAPFLDGLTDRVIILSSTPAILDALAPRHKHHLYIELQFHEHAKWKRLRQIYRRYDLPVVATNDVLFRSPKEQEVHRLLRAIGTNTTISTLPPHEIGETTQYFTREEEQRALLGDISEEAFRNTERIAEECNVEFDLKTVKFGKFSNSDGRPYLRELAATGFQNRYSRPGPEHHARFEHELKVIAELGATDYFLAVHDMIQFAKHKNFPYLGRGSGANSLIAYCLDISNVDPIANHLRLERFLNPSRPTPPDFDIDFSWKDRYTVINYMLDKYGKDKAAMLCTVPRYRAKGGIREIGKAFGAPESDINRFKEYYNILFVNGNIRKDGRNLPQTKAIDDKRLADYKQWDRMAKAIQGFPHHLSVHAGGLVVADKAMGYYTPTQMAPIGVPITQQDMFAADDWKLVKLDILATRGLGTYWDTMHLVTERTGTRPPLEDHSVAFNDERTKEIIRTGKTRGCFYIESPAMIGLLRKLQTDTFENLTAASSVIRPGVAQSGMMQEFIARHRDPNRRPKIHPKLDELMKDTYGVMVYQEDVLVVAHEIAGIDYGKADIMRRAMSGKARDHERVSDLREDFLRGAIANDVEPDIAREIWRQMESFSGYSFCKAHSASYAVLSFQEAWLKVYYPAEFLCSVLNNQGGFYRHQEYIDEAKLLGVKLLLPDVNKSEEIHTCPESGVIQLGFLSFKDVTQSSIKNLLRNREESGAYRSIEDFTERSGVTPEDGKLMIELGACDSLNVSRPRANLRFFTKIKRTALRGGDPEQSLLHFPDEPFSYDLSHIEDYDALYRFRRERNCFGYSVTNHPYDFLKPYTANTVKSSELSKCIGQDVTVVGHISASKTVRTRRDQLMLMLNLSDDTGMMDIVIWPEEFKKYYQIFSLAEALRITGKVAESFGVTTLEARTIERLEFVETPQKPTDLKMSEPQVRDAVLTESD